MKKLITGLLTASLLLGACFAMPAAAGEPENYDPDAVVTMAFNGAWDLICPLAATADYGDCIANPIFDRLVEEDGKGGYAPRLCESFELSEDGKIFTMHLQQNATWHDGEPFTADDVVFTFQLYSNANLTTSRRLFLQGIDGCDASGVELEPGSIHVEKVDDYTVNIYYANPRSVPAIFTSNRYFTILPKHCLEDKDPATILEDDFWTAPIGTGPFKYESQVPGESVTFTTTQLGGDGQVVFCRHSKRFTITNGYL